MIYIYFGKFSGRPGAFVIKRLIYVEFGVPWKRKEKEKKMGREVQEARMGYCPF